MAIVTCNCGTKNRLPTPVKQRIRCGKCKHIFTIMELVKAAPEPRPAMGDPSDLLKALFGGGSGGTRPGFNMGDVDLDSLNDEELTALLMGEDEGDGDDCIFTMAPVLGPLRGEIAKRAVAEREQRPCYPKTRHPNEASARKQMKHVIDNKLAKDLSRIHVYQCPNCSTRERLIWHVGHSAPKRVRA